MADTSLRARLSRLFSTNVIVRRIAKNRLKVVDTNRLQSSGAVSNSYIDRFSGLHRGQSGYGGYNQTMNFYQSNLLQVMKKNNKFYLQFQNYVMKCLQHL